jgi:MYXO-CTERM domain-containing protein
VGTYTITVAGTTSSAMHATSVTLNVTSASSKGGGCGCGAGQKPDPATGALFLTVLGLVVRRRRSPRAGT